MLKESKPVKKTTRKDLEEFTGTCFRSAEAKVDASCCRDKKLKSQMLLRLAKIQLKGETEEK